MLPWHFLTFILLNNQQKERKYLLTTRTYLFVFEMIFKPLYEQNSNKTVFFMNEIRFSSPLRLLFRLTLRKIADRKLGYKNKLKISGQFSPSKKKHFEIIYFYLSWYGGIRDALSK